jgi:hypothetical protein
VRNLNKIQILCLLLLAPLKAVADAVDVSRFELTPFVGYGFGGDFEDLETGADLELDEAETFGLIINIAADATTQWEVLYLQQSTELDTGDLFREQPIVDVDVHYLHGGGTYLLDGDRVQPYVAGSLGLSRLDPGSPGLDAENYFSFSLGVGLRLLPSERIGLRLEGRWFGTFVDSDSAIFCESGGSTNVCAIKVQGSLINQWHGFLGVTFRF